MSTPFHNGYFGVELDPTNRRKGLRSAVKKGFECIDGFPDKSLCGLSVEDIGKAIISYITRKPGDTKLSLWKHIERMNVPQLEELCTHLYKTYVESVAEGYSITAKMLMPSSLTWVDDRSIIATPLYEIICTATTNEQLADFYTSIGAPVAPGDEGWSVSSESVTPATTTTTTAKEEKNMSDALTKLSSIQADIKPAVNALLKVDIDELIASMKKQTEEVVRQATEMDRLRKELAAPKPVASSGTSGASVMPEGKATLVSAKAIWPMLSIDLDVPQFDWDSTHPDVPEIDNNFVFQEEPLLVALLALVGKKNAWFYGPTGSGKSSLIKQIAARLNWPLIDVPFDAEITRIEAVGRDKIVAKSGITETEFVYGILPKALSGPYILLMDEMDFIREDVAYVMQTVLADRKLTLQEDGGKVILAHEYFRAIATANTKGQGDRSGLYRGARIQSSAFLDRFQLWATVDYISKEEETKLIASKTGLAVSVSKKLAAFAKDCRTALAKGEIMQPISARTILSIGENITRFTGAGASEDKAATVSFKLALGNRLNEVSEVNTIEGIFKRNLGIA